MTFSKDEIEMLVDGIEGVLEETGYDGGGPRDEAARKLIVKLQKMYDRADELMPWDDED